MYRLRLQLPMLMWVVLGLRMAAILCCSVQLLRQVDCCQPIARLQLLLRKLLLWKG
jgi:hypothetical protein